MAGKYRMRNGVREALYGGYVSWCGKDGLPVPYREIQVWLPASLGAADDCDEDTETVFKAVEAKARKRWKKASCNQIWRY